MLVAAPYVVTRGLLPRIAGGLLSAQTLQGAFLWGWMAEGGMLSAVLLSTQLRRGFTLLHNSLRDEKYLVGRELRNYTREEATPVSSVQ